MRLHELPHSGYFSTGKNFHQFRHLAKILSENYFSCTNDYTVDVATFTALANIKSGEIFMQYSSSSFWRKFPLYSNVITYTKFNNYYVQHAYYRTTIEVKIFDRYQIVEGSKQ